MSSVQPGLYSEVLSNKQPTNLVLGLYQACCSAASGLSCGPTQGLTQL